jgi:hypothetical protein
MSGLGERNYWVKKINVKLSLANGQSIISGKKNQLLNNLDGLGSNEISWLVKGSGTVMLEAGAPTAGIKRQEVKL